MKKISALAMAGLFSTTLAASSFAEMAYVKIGGEIRIRDEWKNNYDDFDSSLGDATSAIIQRTRVNVDAKIDERVKAYVSLENNRNWGSSGTVTGVGNSTVIGTNNGTAATSNNNGSDTVSLYQGYVVVDKLFDQSLLFKAGRQKIALGNQRLVGANDWGPGQTFDGWILGFNADVVAANLFSVTAADNQGSIAAALPGSNAYINGIYATVKSVPVTSIDVYAIQVKDTTATSDNFITYGARVNGAAMNIDWDAEFALQSGDSSASVKKNASAIWFVAGYSLPEVSKLRIGAEYDQLSGQDTSTSTDDKAFSHLFYTKHSTSNQHSVYGVTDYLETKGGNNGLKAMSLNVSAEPVDGLKLLAEYWNFSSAEEHAAGKTAVGNEMNLQVWYAVTKSTGVHAYYAQFTPSSDFAAKQDAAADAVLQLQVAF